MPETTGSTLGYTAGTWRGLGGGAVTKSSVEFDRQLDKISLWIEKWDHQTRCLLMENLLRKSDLIQFQFVWSVMQPMMHRDFMYTAKKEFPTHQFIPVSTYTSRKYKERLRRSRLDNYHRIKSAHLQVYDHVKEVTKDVELPDIVTDLPVKPEEPIANNNIPRGRHRGTVSKYLTQSLHKSKTNDRLPRLSIDSSCLTSVSDNSGLSSARDSEIPSRLEWLQAAPPCLRFVEMPIRRHMQDERDPRFRESSNHSSLSLRSSPNFRGKKRRKKRRTEMESEVSQIPEDAWQLIHWYTEEWDNMKRNEFLHKFLLKLDPRQHYFISAFLSIQQYRDFLELLPENLALKILGYLSPIEIINASRVSKHWYKLCNNDDLWKMKCLEMKVDVPSTSSGPKWKQIFRESLYIKLNWSMGRCNVIDCKGHKDRVLSVTFDRRRLATGSLDKTIKIWSLKDGRCLQTLKGHTKGIWCLTFFTKSLLISGSYDCTLKIWNLRQEECCRTLLSHEGPVWALTRRENILVSASQDRTAKIWDVSRCVLLHTLKGHNAAVFAVTMDEQGSLVITGSADKTVRLWDVESGKQLKAICVSQTTSIMSISYSKGFFACSYGETICIYRADKPKLLKTYSEHKDRIETLELTIVNPAKAEGTIVSGGKDGCLKYWDLTKEKSVQTFTGHNKQVNCIHCNETRIASASYDNKVKIWDFSIL